MVISRIETLKFGAPTSVTGNKSAMKSFSSVSKNYIHTLKPFSFLLAAPYLVTFLSTIGRPASGFVYSRFFWSPDKEAGTLGTHCIHYCSDPDFSSTAGYGSRAYFLNKLSLFIGLSMRRVSRATVAERITARAEGLRAGAVDPAVVAEVERPEVDEGPYYAAYFNMSGFDLCCIYIASRNDPEEFRRRFRMSMLNELRLHILGLGEEYAGFLHGKEVAGIPAIWIIDRVLSGWNSWGCTSWGHLNALTLAQSQVELIPDPDDAACGVVHRLRYSSVPFLSLHPRRVRVVSTLVTRSTGHFHAIVAPRRLVVACGATPWRATATTEVYLEDLAAQIPNDEGINSAAAFTACLDTSYDEFVALIAEGLDPGVAVSITPDKNKRSIFENDLSAWGAFMGGFAYDDYGSISVGRALAAIPVAGYVGDCADVMRWKVDPGVFKIPTVMTSTVNHTVIPVDDSGKWPENFVYYNPTPKSLQLYLQVSGNIAPAYLAMPITSVLSNAPQVEIYGSFCDKVTITVACASTPLIVFGKAGLADVGFPGDSMKKLLPKLERAFIRGFLLLMQRLLTTPLNEFVPSTFSIVPTEESTMRNPDVTIVFGNGAYPVTNSTYMTMSDDMILMMAGTPHTGDVRIDGVAVAGIAGGVKGRYPVALFRAVPRQRLKVKDRYTLHNAELVGVKDVKPAYAELTRAAVRPGGFIKPHLGAAAPPPEPPREDPVDEDLDGEPI